MNERALFLEALEIGDARAQQAWLDHACADNVELRSRLQRLLLVMQQTGGFLETPPAALGAGVDHETEEGLASLDSAAERPGAQIGPYTLLEQTGEGGMGQVFVAEQHEPVRRKVALKVIKPGMDTRDCLARFEAEQQALALMDHPNIARVLDAGATAWGRPYFVMELVQGTPITLHSDENRLGLRERLELFVQVCHAVQHAHQKGIIHRDIKPANVLVAMHDGKPVVKVIDFGVAKATGAPLTERTIQTGLMQMVGTPLYMSPEQAGTMGLDIDTRTDIYSLGVLLYELLTGTTPFDKERIRQAAYHEICRIIREVEPQKPSTRISTSQGACGSAAQRRTDPAKLKKLLRGDLDWIVMKALEKDRNRRYETASALALDVQHYLADEPVLACPPSAWYRLQKFARRHQGPMLVASALAMALLVAVGSLSASAVTLSASNAQVTLALSEKSQALEHLQLEKTKTDEALAREHQALEDIKIEQRRTKRALSHHVLSVAEREWWLGNLDKAEAILEESPPELRGWEWHHLKRLSRSPWQTLRPGGHVRSLMFSPDAAALYTVSAGRGGALFQQWDPGSGKEIGRVEGIGAVGVSNALSPDGRMLAVSESGARTSSLRVWDIPTGQQLMALEFPPRAMIRRIAFSPDSKQLAGVGSIYLTPSDQDSDGRSPLSKVWNVATGQELLDIGAETGGLCVAYSADGKLLATGGTDGRVRIWDLASAKERLALRLPGSADVRQPGSVAFRPGVDEIAVALRDGTVRVYDFSIQQERLTLYGNSTGLEFSTGAVATLAFSPDGSRLAWCDGSHLIRLWDAQNGSHLTTFRGHTGSLAAVAFHPDGRRLASGGQDGTVRIWELPNDRFRFLTGGPGQIPKQLAFRSDGALVAYEFPIENNRELTSQVRGRDLLTDQEVVRFPHPAQVTHVAAEDGGSHIATACRDNHVRVWDARSGAEVLTIALGGSGQVLCISGDGSRVAVLRPGQLGIEVYETASGAQLAALPRQGSVAGSVYYRRAAFSPDGRHLALLMSTRIGVDRTVLYVWDLNTGAEVFQLPCLASYLCFSPDGRRLAVSAGGESLPEVWDFIAGVRLLKLHSQARGVDGLTFSPDGRRLVTCGSDGLLRIWDTESGRDLLAMPGLRPSNRPFFSPDGHRLFAIGVDGTGRCVRVWDGSP